MNKGNTGLSVVTQRNFINSDQSHSYKGQKGKSCWIWIKINLLP